jgi:hypothetical protein
VKTWLLLAYKIPREPSAPRVSIWRKLKQLGAVLLHDAVWVLPASPRTQEQFQWLAAEIIECGGEATICDCELLDKQRQAALVRQFSEQTDAAYQEILAALNRKNPDHTALARRYQQVLAQDYFQSKLGDRVRTVLLKRKRNSP